MNGSFINDGEKMVDFLKLTKKEFLESYSYLSQSDWYDTLLAVNYFYNKRVQEIYD